MKTENWNEHPKKPAQSTIDDLKIPYVQAMRESKAKLGGERCGPIKGGGQPDFASKVKGTKDFSDPSFFKTVFISGEGIDAEEALVRKQE